jgi:spore cortex protein
MKKFVFLIATLIFSLYLTGCAKNNLNDNNVANRDRNANRNNITDVRNSNDNRSKMRVADEVAKKVSDMPEVDTANVIVTKNNAYVAAKLNGSTNLTSTIEDKISRKVKSVDPDIDNVYVSVNPNFFKQMNDYARDIRNGRPITGLFKEISDSIRRVFPDVK